MSTKINLGFVNSCKKASSYVHAIFFTKIFAEPSYVVVTHTNNFEYL